MLRLWKFTLFFLLCLVLALLINLPVKHVLPYVKLPQTVRLTGIDGNLFSGSIEEVQCTRDKDMQEGQASPRAPISDTEVGAQLFTLDVFPEVIRDLDILVAGVRVEVKRLSSTLRA